MNLRRLGLWLSFLWPLALAAITHAHAAATVGQSAPAFALPDTSGKTVSLGDFKGKTVVL